MLKLRTIAALLACFVLAAAFLTGCSELESLAGDVEDRSAAEEPTETLEPTETPTEEPTETPEPEESEAPLYNAYGTGEEEALFTNSTDFVFRSLQIQGPTETEYGDNLLAADAPIQQGETFAVKYTPDTAEVTPDPEEEVLFSDDVYNLKLTTDAGEEYVIYDNDFPVMDTAFIRWDEEGDVLYLEFQNKTSGDLINTLEAQLFMKDLSSGAIDETPVEEARAIADKASSGSGSSGGSSSGNSGSSGSSSSSGSSGSAGSSSSSGSSGSSDSSGSSAVDESSGSSGSDDDWSGGSSDSNDCLEDNIVWND